MNPFAAAVLGGLPPTNGPGRSNNDEALLLIRDYGDKFDAKIDGQINDRMTAFLRFSQRKDLQYYAARPHRALRRRRQRLHSRHRSERFAGYTWTVTPTSLFEARLGFSHIVAGKEPPYLGGPSMQSLFGGFQGLPTTPSLTGGLNTQTISGLHRPGPPNQQSAVSESYLLGSEVQLFEDPGQAFPQDGLSNT